jgi:hypothetical protein
VRPLQIDGINLSPTEAKGYHQNCTGEGCERKPGTCILNGFFVGFLRNRVVFRTVLDEITNENVPVVDDTSCFGPNWIAHTLLKACINDVADIGVRAEPLLRNGDLYISQPSALVSLMVL